MHAAARYKPRSPLGLMLLGAAALLLAGSARATIINPDFSSAFDGWQGEWVEDDGVFDPQLVSPVAPEFTLTGTGLAMLTNNDLRFELSLFQVFVLPDDAGTIALDYGWMISDPFDFMDLFLTDVDDDVVFSLLVSAGVDPTQPSGSGRLEVDVSSMAGRSVELRGFLQDGDFLTQDMLTFGNIVIASAPVSVPAPASGLLVILGTLLVAVRRRR